MMARVRYPTVLEIFYRHLGAKALVLVNPTELEIFYRHLVAKALVLVYRTRAIISRGLYFFLPSFHFSCGLYYRQFMY